MKLVVIGVQGSGKGTQAKLLVEKFGWQHITTGDLFRRNIEQKTELGLIAKTYIDRGDLVPDEYVFRIVKSALESAKEGFILDGFLRNQKQMDFLSANFQLDKAILLDLSDEVAIRRITARRHCEQCKTDYNLLFKKPKNDSICDLCGGKIVQRDDDNEAAIIKRIEKFHQETKSVIEFFRKNHNLIRINADQPVIDIHHEIIDGLDLR